MDTPAFCNLKSQQNISGQATNNSCSNQTERPDIKQQETRARKLTGQPDPLLTKFLLSSVKLRI